MGSLIEMLASKKKAAAPPMENVVILPVMRKEHEGSCGPNCACSGEEESGCCG
ncbi:MAG TPA: hypothetical protein VIL58_05140 [Thermoplasmata archaeon]